MWMKAPVNAIHGSYQHIAFLSFHAFIYFALKISTSSKTFFLSNNQL